LKKLLLQLDVERLPSAFDAVVAFDGGADDILQYGGVKPEDVAALVQGAIFTRGTQDLSNTAIFVGGGDVPAAQKVFAEIPKNFFGPFRVSAMLDPNGSNTTAAAAVRSVERVLGTFKGTRSLVLAGVGAVGTRTVTMLARAGSRVMFTGSNPQRLEAKLKELRETFGDAVDGRLAPRPGQAADLFPGVDLVIAAGPEGLQLITLSDWSGAEDLKVAVDLNAVPPLGIEGIEATDNDVERHGKRVFGALGVGKLKMKLHKRCIAALFEKNDHVFDAETIFDMAHSL
jgi:methylenetetrahydrofolate/methylenetetrahydromethanopterin dehydrogenase (NADP+)